MIMASSIEVDENYNQEVIDAFQNNNNTVDNEKKWRNYMLEKEQIFNIEFDNKVSANNKASNSNPYIEKIT